MVAPKLATLFWELGEEMETAAIAEDAQADAILVQV